MGKARVAAVWAGMGVAAFAAFGEGTNGIAELPQVTVYASRIDDAKDAMPEAVSVFTAAEIESSGAQDLPELLKKKAGIDIHAMNGNPLLTSIAMRGFGDNAFGRVKVVLDGEELNNVDMNAPNLARIPLGSAARVEVIHGPSPVLYGDGAIAGVVNVSTEQQDYSKRTKIAGKAGSQGTFGGNAQTRGGVEEDGLLYNASYDYLRSDGYRERSAYDIHTANAAVRKNFGDGSSAGLKANFQNAFYELPGSLTYDQWKNDRKAANNREDRAHIWSYGIGFDSKAKLAEDQWLRLDGGFSEQYRHARYPSSLSDLEYDAYCLHLSPRYVNEADVADFGNKFTVGIDIRYDKYCEDHPSSFGFPVDRHFDRTRCAAFIHDGFDISESLSVVAGTRLERISNRWAHYAGLAENDSHDWMGDCELGIVFRPAEGLKTYVKGTKFHRSAFCDELSYTQDGKFLEPETGESIDIGAEWELPDGFAFDVNGYFMVMEDEIFYDPVLPPYGYNCNSPAETHRIGIDAGLSWRREKVAEAMLRYGLVRARFDGGTFDGCDVPYVPEQRLRAEAGYWLCDDLEVKGGCTFVDSQYLSGDFANQSDKLPSYTLFDVGAYYSPSWTDGWKAAFVMDNLFDKDYCDCAGVGYYYPACGRSFMFTLSCEF